MEWLKEKIIKYFSVFVWLLLLSTAADGANVDDLFTHSPILHTDAPDSSFLNECILSCLFNNTNFSNLSDLSHLLKPSKPINLIRHVIIDEDSPSIPQFQYLYINTYFLTVIEKNDSLTSFNFTSLLYILFSVLLI